MGVLAIKDYKGGVLIISHNKEFCDNVATEKWIMKGGYLRIEGESVEREEDKVDGNKVQEDVYDGAGNKIDVKQNATLSAKDAKMPSKTLRRSSRMVRRRKRLPMRRCGSLKTSSMSSRNRLQPHELRYSTTFLCG